MASGWTARLTMLTICWMSEGSFNAGRDPAANRK